MSKAKTPLAENPMMTESDVLTADTKRARSKYRDVVIDRVSIDEIMVMLVKGERI